MQVKKISGEVKAIVGKGGQVTIPAGKRKKDGIKEGKFIRWNSFGRKLYVANYKNGIRDGKTKEFFINRFNERIKLYEKTFRNGKVISKIIYKNKSSSFYFYS